jgi:two-component system, NtrC family, nitrogen regulation sensor histidine kinase NtrY
MGSKNFRISLIIRVLLLVANVFVIMWLLFSTRYYFTMLLAVAIAIYQIVKLISYVETTNTLLTNFLESLKYSDFSRTFEIKGLGHSFDRMTEAFSLVIDDFRKVREEREQNYFYLETVVEHIGIALISYRQDGKVELINNSTKKLFKINSLKKLEELNHFSAELVNKLMSISNGESIMVKIQNQDEILQLAIYATEFKVANRNIKMATIKDIRNELEENEMESWQKLIRVLTHEIMNSITPIASITQSLNTIIKDVRQKYAGSYEEEGRAEAVEEIEMAVDTIHKRSVGLLHFVESYRDLTRIPNPKYSIFQIKMLFDNLKGLMKEELNCHNIECIANVVPENLELSADEQLIEQVLINLIKNAVQALEKTEKPRIELKAFPDPFGKIVIQLSDNGQGILPEVLDKIFVPFFSTKPKGSGIGLSLSRQILRLHGGSLTARSIPEVETVFTLKF